MFTPVVPPLDVKGLASTEDDDAEGATPSTEARSWNNRSEQTVEDGFTRGGESPRPTSERQPGPTRNPERDWGVVLVTLAVVAIVLAGAVSFSVLMGGLLGVLSVRGAVVLTLLLVGIGLVGLRQGLQAYRGR